MYYRAGRAAVRMSALTMPSPSRHSNNTFPDTFHDFFNQLPVDFEMSLLEEKHLPMVDEEYSRLGERQWSFRQRRSYRRRQEPRSPMQPVTPLPVSPQPPRRRSCSIGVTRALPDINRFLQAEQQQRGWRSPSPNNGTKSPRSLSRHSPVNSEATYSRTRTSSMPIVPRQKPTLAQTKRSEEGVEYYRLRSFSITPNGIFNLGDSLKSRRSTSINSVNSADSSHTDLSNRERLSSNTSWGSNALATMETEIPTYRVAMLGASGVGKTALTHQFTTSEYICAYDASLDEEFGQKKVSVMLDSKETELEIIDHPYCEMSAEAFCSTYNPDVFVVVYSIEDRHSLKIAEEILMFLWKSDYTAHKAVILVGNKADLERKREVTTSGGRKLASSYGCKFIETSSGLDHNVDELLVGILAQVRLNPQRNRTLLRNHLSLRRGRKLLKHLLLGLKRKSKSCENLLSL